MLTLVWRPQARDDLISIIDFIAERDFPAAQRLGRKIEAAAEKVPDHPLMHRPGGVPGTREAIVHPNYLLIYRVTAETVEVVSVVHARQRYP